MCPYCPHSLDDHDVAGTCIACAREHGACKDPPTAFVTIHVAGGAGDVIAVTLPASTTSVYAAKRAAETLGLDPETRDWFLYDPVARVPLKERESVAAYHGRVLKLAWTEERG